MPKALIVDNISQDADRLRAILEKKAVEVVVRNSGRDAEILLSDPKESFAMAFLSSEIPGPPFGLELIVQCRKTRPQMPVVVISGALDVGLATRAAGLGASDFLEKPLEDARLRSCLLELLKEVDDPTLPMVQKLREIHLGGHGERLVGESPAFLDSLRQVAKVVTHPDSRVLILGESGTGKELVAKAIHRLGSRQQKPWEAVNIGETPNTLVESTLFGNERGAFTDAREFRKGLLEVVADGTLFLDEIGDLELPLQGKLLRVIQERQFRRLGGTATLGFNARLICATNKDLAQSVEQGSFRRDLYHRIAEVVINIPPLRERHGDINLLLDYFLQVYKQSDQSFAAETRTILQSYPFPGNIRELQNLVKGALIQSDGDVVLPRHLPLASMGKFLQAAAEINHHEKELESSCAPLEKIFGVLKTSIPSNWLDLPYRDAMRMIEHAFDRIYLQRRLDKASHNITRAASSSGWDTKTFRKHWKECGLPPLNADEEQPE